MNRRADMLSAPPPAPAPAPEPAPQAAGQEDVYDALERIGRLRDQGVLSETEFDREKARILSGY